jgi:hypothetical protein
MHTIVEKFTKKMEKIRDVEEDMLKMPNQIQNVKEEMEIRGKEDQM